MKERAITYGAASGAKIHHHDQDTVSVNLRAKKITNTTTDGGAKLIS